MKKQLRRVGLVLFCIAVSVGLFWLLFRQIEPARLGAVLGRAEVLPLSLAVLSSLAVNLLLSSLAFQQALLAHGVKIRLRAAAAATLGHLAPHAGATFVVGKAARALYVSRVHAVEMKRALGAELTLLVMKVAALLVLSALGALFMGAIWLVPGAVLMVLGAFVWCRRRGVDLGALAASFAWALAMGLGQLGVFALALTALGSEVPVLGVVALFPLCLLGAKVPVALLGLGVRETLVVMLLRGAAPPEALLGASLIFSLVEQVLPGLLGLAFAPRFVARALRG